VPLRRRLSVYTLGALAVIAIVAIVLLRSAGTALVLDDALRPAQAVVVLGGDMPFRAMEAASVYKQGGVREVWLTPGWVSVGEKALADMGIDHPPEYEYSRQVLERLGVPASAIVVIPGHQENTAQEMQAISRQAETTGGGPIIIVTSKYHTRRVHLLWRWMTGDHVQALVRYSRDDPSTPEHWWRDTADAMSVTHEWLGILNAWAGFPIGNER
jgi:uncharacterized SAM-binding protein YcdF (DUF218 family)